MRSTTLGPATLAMKAASLGPAPRPRGGGGGCELLGEVEGDTVSEVLSYVEYEPKRLLEKFKAKAEKAVKEHGATLEELKELVATYRDSLRGYTYYESD